MQIKITANMYAELEMSEVEPYRSDHGPGGDPIENQARELMIQQIENARSTKTAVYIEITPETASQWMFNLDCDIDKWGDWGTEGVPFTRAGRRIMSTIKDAFPKEAADRQWRSAWEFAK